MPAMSTAVLSRRTLLAAGLALTAAPALAAPDCPRLIAAARRQIGVTTGYDPAYRKLAYPGGDLPRETGVCADVIVRGARDAFGLDLQRLVHEDMTAAFSAYPKKWGLPHPDANIDHRRVPNLETYWRRSGAEVWRGRSILWGSGFPGPLQPGDILTWRLPGGGSHVGLVSQTGLLTRVIHNIGGGAQEVPLLELAAFSPYGLYRWPKA